MMKLQFSVSIMLLLFLAVGLSSSVQSELNVNGISIDQTSKGVVLIDDTHSNDYSNGNLDSLNADLDSLGFIPYFVSDFTSWDEAFGFANYFIMTAPLADLAAPEIATLVSWAEAGTRGILISSRGDFSDVSFSSVNTLLTDLGADVRVQDDNVYSTDTGTSSIWSTQSSNIQNVVPELVTGVSKVAMFSPSSLRFISSTADVIIYGDGDEYQVNTELTPPPQTIYDDTSDGVGGTSIPLVSHEELSLGTTVDKLIVTGVTMWSDFDYPSNQNNIDFLRNVINYFHDHIVSVDGSVSVTVPDGAPTIKFTSPRADSFVKGTISIQADITDRVAIDTVELYIDDALKSNVNTYTWDTTLETKGEHTIKIEATNVNGFSTLGTIIVTVDQDYVPTVSGLGKVMEYNIKQAGIDPLWLDVMKEENADIAILVETGGWDDDGNAKLNENMKILNDYFDDEVNYAGALDKNEGSTSGVAILSRYPVNSVNEISSVTLDDGSSWTPSHDFLHVNVQVGDTEIAVFGGHLKCCDGADNELKRENAQEGLINYMDGLGDIPIIYASDMNSFYPGEGGNLGSEPISMLVDSANEHGSSIHTFTDVHRALNPGVDADTYETGSRIDFIFVNQHLVDLMQSSTTADTVSGKLGSDHFSVDVTLDFRAFLGLPTTSVSTTTTTTDDISTTSSISDITSSSKESDSSLRLEFFVLPVIFLVVFKLKKQFKN
ncbi:MAG: hypothetical protein GPJ54_17495 [Candidatus Heimdallarchaeota archaeon]|nr:hypothetical protein [Candidatus Heimdallarchaeota archaeon]